jgi:hypothetical protein
MYIQIYINIHIGKSAVIDCYENQKNKLFKQFFKNSKSYEYLKKEKKIDNNNTKIYKNIKNAKSLYSVENCKCIHMCMYVYRCICICMCLCTHVYEYIYRCIDTYLNKHTY